MMTAVRRLTIYFTLIMLLAVSISTGYIASDWPHWCERFGWCQPAALSR